MNRVQKHNGFKKKRPFVPKTNINMGFNIKKKKVDLNDGHFTYSKHIRFYNAIYFINFD